METNDYWTHVGMVIAFFVVIVGPRMFQSDYAKLGVVYIIGGALVIGIATLIRLRGRSGDRTVPAESQSTPEALT